MEEVLFLVQGSDPEPYKVAFHRYSDGRLLATCTCQAGQNGTYCKHRLAILAGEISAIVSGNITDVHAIANWLPGSPLRACLDELSDAEKKMLAAQKLVSKIKKKLAATMYGRKA